MLALRSAAFNLLFYVNLLLWMVAYLPGFLLPRIWFIRVAQGWARSSLWLLRVVAGTRIEVRGRERIPAGGLLVASKHQSLWETFAHFTLFDDPAYILKRELMWIPLFGWFAAKGGMVPVDRSGGAAALAAMNERTREEARRGRQIIIFPEGTRRAAGAEPSYKYGVAHLYASLGVPILPIALNSGLYWPRRSFLRRPGTIVVEILDPIAPGLDRDVVFRELQARLEAASGRLLVEGRRELGLDRSERALNRTTSSV
jgi:1-acyl-sn-glycerol-3-phosphate acyltransferase